MEPSMRASAILLSMILATGSLCAQSLRGVILGRVTDQSAAVVPGGQVTLLNQATNISQTATTSEQGEYTFTNLEPGAYEVTVAAAGFKTRAVRNVTVYVNQTVRVDVTLELGSV